MGNDYKECEKYNLEITNPYELKNISDKLRYLRLKESMYQEDVAKMIGIDRTTYVSYETGLRIYPLDVMKKISDLYKIDLDALLDDYHNFIYNNQGQNIKSIRKELGISQKELADSLGVSLIVIKRAEQEKVRFLEKNYIKLMNYYNLQKQLSV
ncbi:MAG: transcriptional regulator [Clostridia bacterium]|nr:transcriptional regulator [Clostridia bacterium]